MNRVRAIDGSEKLNILICPSSEFDEITKSELESKFGNIEPIGSIRVPKNQIYLKDLHAKYSKEWKSTFSTQPSGFKFQDLTAEE